MKRKRKYFCGECLKETDGGMMHLDGTSKCVAVPARPRSGTPLEFKVDVETNRVIEQSGLDPRVSEYWERHAASDGNKGWRSWKGVPVVHVQIQQRKIVLQDSYWCATCGGYRKWTHECRPSNYRGGK